MEPKKIRRTAADSYNYKYRTVAEKVHFLVDLVERWHGDGHSSAEEDYQNRNTVLRVLWEMQDVLQEGKSI